MQLDKRIVKRLKELCDKGAKILKHHSERQYDGFLNDHDFHEWLTSSESLLERVFGRDSIFYNRFVEIHQQQGEWENTQYVDSEFLQAFGVLKAAYAEYSGGYLVSVRKLIRAELFDEFLDQATYLYESDYYQPAAVIAGAVLEDGLRKLCQDNGIKPPGDKPNLNSFNAELAKANVYGKLVQKNVTAWADLRNNAAHGKWTEFTDKDVELMIAGVRNFMGTHFS